MQLGPRKPHSLLHCCICCKRHICKALRATRSSIILSMHEVSVHIKTNLQFKALLLSTLGNLSASLTSAEYGDKKLTISLVVLLAFSEGYWAAT